MSWSCAPVRHGAKARLAVAEVLRMPVEDVAVRDRSRLSAILGTGADVDGLELERISVGEHILLGGDNMDLALAYTLQAKLEAEGRSIDSWLY